MTTEGWVAIITAAIITFATSIVIPLANMWFAYKRDKDARDERKEQATKLEAQSVKLASIEHHTNSMHEEVVKLAGAEGVARGGMEERARADERTAGKTEIAKAETPAAEDLTLVNPTLVNPTLVNPQTKTA